MDKDPFLDQLEKSAKYFNERKFNTYIYNILCLKCKLAFRLLAAIVKGGKHG
jgi:hypothetical protein